MVIVVIGFILLVITIRLFIAFNSVSIINSIRRSNKREIDRSTSIEMLRPMLSPHPVAHHSNIYPSILNANAPPIEMPQMPSSVILTTTLPI